MLPVEEKEEEEALEVLLSLGVVVVSISMWNESSCYAYTCLMRSHINFQ